MKKKKDRSQRNGNGGGRWGFNNRYFEFLKMRLACDSNWDARGTNEGKMPPVVK